MTRKTLLRSSAALTFFTFVGHTVSLILPLPEDQKEVLNTYGVMKQTMVPLMMGSSRSIAQLMVGANASLSVYLFVAGALFILLAADSVTPSNNRKIFIVSLGSFVLSVISFIYFFPVPGICTGLASLLGFLSLKHTDKA